jgi:hypothetical protein
MPILDAVKRRAYQNERYRKKKAEADNGDNIKMENLSNTANSQLAQAEEIRAVAREYSERADRLEAAARSTAAMAIDGTDRFGYPIGTHDDQGRQLGQLDTLNEELATLRTNLADLEGERGALSFELRTATVTADPQTTEEKIEAKTKVMAIEALITENDTKIAALKDEIQAKEEVAARQEMEAARHRENIALYSKDGRVYVDKMALAEISLREAEREKSAAQNTLANENYRDEHDRARIQLQSAESRITTARGMKAWLEAQRVETEELLKVYTLKG